MANFIFQVVRLSETGTRTTFSWNQRQISPHSKRTLFWAKSIHMTKSASKLTAWHARTKTEYFYHKISLVISLSPHSQPFSPFCPFPSSPLPPSTLSHPRLLTNVPMIWAELGWYETLSSIHFTMHFSTGLPHIISSTTTIRLTRIYFQCRHQHLFLCGCGYCLSARVSSRVA